MQKSPILRVTILALLASGTIAAPTAWAAGKPETAKPHAERAVRVTSPSGAYLAAKSAQISGDLDMATLYYDQALKLDPTSSMLQQDAMFTYLADGRFEDGVKLAAKLHDSPEADKVARITLGVDALRSGKYDVAIQEFDIANPSDLDTLLLSQLSAWADVGAGRVDAALARIGKLTKVAWYPVFNEYQAGLIADLAGRTQEARDHFNKVLADKSSAQTSPDAYLASAEALARVEARSGRKDAAIAALDKALSLVPTYDPLNLLKQRIQKGETIEPAITSAKAGAAEALYILGQAVNRGDGEQVALLYFQLARATAPASANLLSALAGIAERADKFDLAISYYRQIPKDSAFYRTAELQIGLDLWYSKQKNEAKEHLRHVVSEYPKDLQAHLALADVLAGDKDYAEAAKTLDEAVDLATADKPANWNLYYQRGIAYERLHQWDKAEPNFKKALELSPDQPQVLNYLGYSWVDMNKNLDQGLDMIKTAVSLRPNDGYIIDSLGWAYFRLGRYSDAVEQLERAILITPMDPTINDHLGDAYWRVGRTREAKFQWQRALIGEPKPEPEDVRRIQAKLETGLPPIGEKAAGNQSDKDGGADAAAAQQARTNAAANAPKPPAGSPAKPD